MAVEYISCPKEDLQTYKVINHFLQKYEKFVPTMESKQFDMSVDIDRYERLRQRLWTLCKTDVQDDLVEDDVEYVRRLVYRPQSLYTELLEVFAEEYVEVANAFVRMALRTAHEDSEFEDFLGRRCGVYHIPSLKKYSDTNIVVESDLYVVMIGQRVYVTFLKPTQQDDGLFTGTGQGFPKKFRTSFRKKYHTTTTGVIQHYKDRSLCIEADRNQ